MCALISACHHPCFSDDSCVCFFSFSESCVFYFTFSVVGCFLDVERFGDLSNSTLWCAVCASESISVAADWPFFFIYIQVRNLPLRLQILYRLLVKRE